MKVVVNSQDITDGVRAGREISLTEAARILRVPERDALLLPIAHEADAEGDIWFLRQIVFEFAGVDDPNG